MGAAVALVAVGAVGGWWWSSRGTAATAATTSRTQLVAATLGTVKQTISASGTIEPAQQSTASFTSSGSVTSVSVAVGDKVTKGQKLATIDSTSLAAAVTLADASVSAAQDQVNTATTSAAIASAKAQLASAQNQLATAQAALDGATLTAPISGTVSSVGIAVGDQVGSSGGSSGGGFGGSSGAGSSGAGSSGGTSSSSSSTGITIVDTSSWVVNATVSSSDLGQLKKGLQATITASDVSNLIFGTVSSVGVVASSSSSGTAEFPVVVAVTGHPTGLYAGTTATLAITVKQLSNVLTVPTLAVHTTNGQTTVEVSKNGSVTSVPVTVGGVYGATTEITKGLAEGDEVVVTTRSFAGSGTTNGTSRFGNGQFPGGGTFGGRTFGGGTFGGGGARPGGGAP